MTYASAVETVVDFDDPASKSAEIFSSLIDPLPFPRGISALRTGIETAIGVFNAAPDEDANNVLIILTDGNPRPTRTQLVCEDTLIKDNLDANEITVLVFGVGVAWNPDPINCLDDDVDSQIYDPGTWPLPPAPVPVPLPAGLWLGLGASCLSAGYVAAPPEAMRDTRAVAIAAAKPT